MREEVSREFAKDFEDNINLAVREYDDAHVYLTKEKVAWVWEQYSYKLADYGAHIVWCDSRMAEIELNNGEHTACGIIGAMYNMSNPNFNLNSSVIEQ